MNSYKRRSSIGFRKELAGWLFVMPMLLMFCGFLIYPLIQSVKMSFYSFDYTSYYWSGLQNYIDIFQNDTFLKSIRTTIIFVFIIVPGVTCISLFLSLLIYKQPAKLQAFFKASFYIPAVTSIISLTMVWEYIYNQQFGLANYVMKALGLEPINWLGVDFGIISLCVVFISLSIGASIVILTAGLNGIPTELYEAAEIDGAKKAKVLFSITLPLLKPSLLYVIVTGTISAFQVFVLILLMTGGGPAYKTTTMLMLIYREAFTNMNLGVANAMGIVLIAIITLISIIQFKFMKTEAEY